MKPEELEQLLHEDESATMDFKRDQYAFAKASDEDKSELIKDILGFVNCWRRSEAFIVIGVEEVPGGRGRVHGVAEHLADHSLQQFVNSLTNRPVRFGYETCEFETKQVGIIRIDLQDRPVYLKRDYGKLKEREVYVRRGSSTDPTRPASPDEIATMGTLATGQREASVSVSFADPDRDKSYGNQVELTAEFCQMPAGIPDHEDQPTSVTFPGGPIWKIPTTPLGERANRDYYRELANYIFVRRLLKKVRLMVANIGDTPARDVRLEVQVSTGEGVEIIDHADLPDEPESRKDLLNYAISRVPGIRPATGYAGEVLIETNAEQTKVEIECGNLQPGRRIFSDSFFVGIRESGEIELNGHVFAANLSQPLEFTLSFNARITKSTMTIEELVSWESSRDESE